MARKPSIYVGKNLEALIDAYRGDLSEPSVSGIINTITDRYNTATAEAMPELTEAEWSCIVDCLNGCGTLLGTGGLDPAAYIWAEVADSPEIGAKWGVDTGKLSAKLQALPYSGKCGVWDVAAKFWASPELNSLGTGELLKKCGAKTNGGGMSDKLTVATGIMDDSEYISTNLSSVESVQAYAENGCGIVLSEQDAKLVLDVCRAMHQRLEDGEIPGTNDWFHNFDKPLSE